MIKPQTLKGFRDFLPQEAKKRQFVINTFRKVFERYGFEPMETPTLEFDEVLTGKYGEEGEKLMYRFEDHGKRKVAMRYDQTVPLARFVAQHQNSLPFPFKRYQIQNVWRAENTQKGRYREFTQCDIDIVGLSTPLSDAEVIKTALASYDALGFNNVTVLLNDRNIFNGLSNTAISIIDKLGKIGTEGVCTELYTRGVANSYIEAKHLLQTIMEKGPTLQIKEILSILKDDSIKISFSPTLARGLDYYTGIIFEVISSDYPAGSLCGGGRFDNLIGMFSGQKIPAVGFAVGFDRTIEAMIALQLFPQYLLTTQVLVTIFSSQYQNLSLNAASELRSKRINTEIYLDASAKMDKQLKYADQKGIPYAIIIGSEEASKNLVTLKNLRTREQKQVTLEQLPDEII